jgi:hypothetical protein
MPMFLIRKEEQTTILANESYKLVNVSETINATKEIE